MKWIKQPGQYLELTKKLIKNKDYMRASKWTKSILNEIISHSLHTKWKIKPKKKTNNNQLS